MRKSKPFKLTPPDPSEDQFQKSVADLFDRILDENQVVWSHFPAGGYFLSKAARARLYRLGLKTGFPDIVICYSLGRTLWLECKTYKGVMSPAQRVKHLQLRLMGHQAVVVRCIEDVIAALIEHHVPFRKSSLDRSYHGAAETIPSTAQSEPAELSQGAA